MVLRVGPQTLSPNIVLFKATVTSFFQVAEVTALVFKVAKHLRLLS